MKTKARTERHLREEKLLIVYVSTKPSPMHLFLCARFSSHTNTSRTLLTNSDILQTVIPPLPPAPPPPFLESVSVTQATSARKYTSAYYQFGTCFFMF